MTDSLRIPEAALGPVFPRIVSGTFHQATPGIFDHPSAGAQCTTIALMALIFAAARHSVEMSTEDINEVLIEGNRAHVNTLRLRELEGIQNRLHVDELETSYRISHLGRNFQATINFKEHPFLSRELGDYIYHQTQLSESQSRRYFILRTQDFSRSIFANADGSCSLFDSHSCNHSGRPDPDGAAYIMHFQNADDLIGHLRDILPQGRDEDQFDLTTVQIELSEEDITSTIDLRTEEPTSAENNLQTSGPMTEIHNTVPVQREGQPAALVDDVDKQQYSQEEHMIKQIHLSDSICREPNMVPVQWEGQPAALVGDVDKQQYSQEEHMIKQIHLSDSLCREPNMVPVQWEGQPAALVDDVDKQQYSQEEMIKQIHLSDSLCREPNMTTGIIPVLPTVTADNQKSTNKKHAQSKKKPGRGTQPLPAQERVAPGLKIMGEMQDEELPRLPDIIRNVSRPLVLKCQDKKGQQAAIGLLGKNGQFIVTGYIHIDSIQKWGDYTTHCEKYLIDQPILFNNHQLSDETVETVYLYTVLSPCIRRLLGVNDKGCLTYLCDFWSQTDVACIVLFEKFYADGTDLFDKTYDEYFFPITHSKQYIQDFWGSNYDLLTNTLNRYLHLLQQNTWYISTVHFGMTAEEEIKIKEILVEVISQDNISIWECWFSFLKELKKHFINRYQKIACKVRTQIRQALNIEGKRTETLFAIKDCKSYDIQFYHLPNFGYNIRASFTFLSYILAIMSMFVLL